MTLHNTSRALALVTLLASCSRAATPPEPSPSHPPLRPPEAPTTARPPVLEPGAILGSPRAPRVTSTAVGVTASHGVSALPTARPSEAPVRLSVSRVTATEGEDGRGNTVPASDPVAIDLETPDGWPGGALATTLRVGDLRFYTMGYPSVTTLRFIVADGRALPPGVEVSLQYGPDFGRRRVIAASLPVTP